MLPHVSLSLGKDHKLSPWSAFFCADQNEITSCNIHKPGSQAQMTLESAELVYKVTKQKQKQKQKHEQNIPNILISAYEFSQLREFDKRSKHFPE